MTPPLVVPNDAQREVFARIAAHAFGFPVEDAPDWFARAGHDNLRVVCDGPRVLGGLIAVPMGQWFGGRSVPMWGVAGVAVAPDARGTGVATQMMRAFVRELHERGVALTTLYPATVKLYRRAGYERAGVRFQVSVEPSAIASAERGLAIERIEREDDEEVRALHRRFASARDGHLDRGPYVWSRVFRPHQIQTVGLKLRGDHGLEGYVVLAHKRSGVAFDTEVVVLDMVATTGRAAERILALLGEYRSLAKRVRFYGGAPDLFTMLLPERFHDIHVADYWMIRVVDVPRALAARGYAPDLATSLELEVDDDLVAENRGRFVLEARDGVGHVRAGGSGALRVSIRGLAALYSGYLPARTLAVAGLLSGDDATLTKADALFRGSTPAMVDMF